MAACFVLVRRSRASFVVRLVQKRTMIEGAGLACSAEIATLAVRTPSYAVQ